MILPPRPLRLRADYTRVARRRIAALAFAALVAALAAALSAWELGHLAELERAWEVGEPVEVVSMAVDDRALGPFHTIVATVVYRDLTGERVALAPPFTLLGELPADVAAARTVRRDPATSRIVPELVIRASPMRRSAALATVVTLLALAALLTAWGWRRARELALTRAVARRSEEVLVGRTPSPRKGRLRLVVPEARATGAYRESAAPRPVVIDQRQRPDEPGPLWVGASRSHAVALRPGPASTQIVVVREDLWPFELSSSEREAVLARLASTARELADQSGAPVASGSSRT